MGFKKVSCAPNKVILRTLSQGNNQPYIQKDGLFIKNNADLNLKNEGTVLVVGDNLKSWIKPGDVVAHGMHSGTVYGSTTFCAPGEEVEALLVLADYEINEVVSEEEEKDTLDSAKTAKGEE